MKAAVLYGKDDIRYESIPDPVPNQGEVLVKVHATGICGSDIPRVLGDAAHHYPIVLGHEFSGEVVALGEGVKHLNVGDRVAGAPLLPCMACDDCQKGNYSQCRFYSFIGSRRQGSFAEYVALPEKNAVKFHESVTFEQGALFEPSTVALHGLFCAGFKGGEDTVILGGGTIGLFTAQWAKIMGARRVFVLDIEDKRLELAKSLGADVTVNTGKQDYLEELMASTSGKGFGYVFETAGLNATMNMAFELAANKAGICFIGTSPRDLAFPAHLFEKMNRKEFGLTGSWMSYSAPFPGREWSLTAHCFANGSLKIDKDMIHRTMPLSEAKEAFELFKTSGLVKGKIMMIASGSL